MEIKDNAFSRQFETTVDGKMLSIEYSMQDKKIFLTKINVPDTIENAEFVDAFLRNVLDIAENKKFKVVPTHPKVAAFIRKNPSYKSLLPPGIRL